MKKHFLLTVLLTTGAFLLSGCSNNAGNGALIGSLVGAGLGKSTSNHRDKRAVIGAVLGGAVGAAIGNERDRAQRSRYTTYSNTPVQTTRAVRTNTNVKHTHHYSSRSETHSHSGGNVKHSHSQEYIESGNYYTPSNVSTSLYISGGSYRHHRPRHYRHRHHRPRHHHSRWY